MKHNQEFAESQSKDPVIREMARIASFILNDTSLSKAESAKLVNRLEIEYRAYRAWQKQYASYFRKPRVMNSQINPSSKADKISGEAP